MRHNAASLLPAVLQGVQAEGGEIRRIRRTNYPEYTAFFAQFIVVKGICVHLVQRLGHAIGSDICRYTPCLTRSQQACHFDNAKNKLFSHENEKKAAAALCGPRVDLRNFW